MHYHCTAVSLETLHCCIMQFCNSLSYTRVNAAGTLHLKAASQLLCRLQLAHNSSVQQQPLTSPQR